MLCVQKKKSQKLAKDDRSLTTEHYDQCVAIKLIFIQDVQKKRYHLKIWIFVYKLASGSIAHFVHFNVSCGFELQWIILVHKCFLNKQTSSFLDVNI